jgi:hypothetical protein
MLSANIWKQFQPFSVCCPLTFVKGWNCFQMLADNIQKKVGNCLQMLADNIQKQVGNCLQMLADNNTEKGW